MDGKQLPTRFGIKKHNKNKVKRFSQSIKANRQGYVNERTAQSLFGTFSGVNRG